jgi:putative SbcD/Mre11-related phosphoesterase
MIDDKIRVVEGLPALLLGRRYLAIADLHIGYEYEAREKGLLLPPLINTFLDRLDELKERTDAKELFILGDVKHSILSPRLEEAIDIVKFFERALKTFDTIHLLPGNHDGGLKPYLPSEVKLYSPHGTVVKLKDIKVGLLHGHALPSKEVMKSKLIVVGHLHLSIRYYNLRLQVWIKAKVRDKEIILLPSFNRYLPGRALSMESPSLPFIREDFIYEGEVYTLEGYNLGKVGQLDRVTVEVEKD